MEKHQLLAQNSIILYNMTIFYLILIIFFFLVIIGFGLTKRKTFPEFVIVGPEEYTIVNKINSFTKLLLQPDIPDYYDVSVIVTDIRLHLETSKLPLDRKREIFEYFLKRLQKENPKRYPLIHKFLRQQFPEFT